MSKVHYLRSDIRRLIKSYPIYLAILGVAAAIWFSLENFALKITKHLISSYAEFMFPKNGAW